MENNEKIISHNSILLFQIKRNEEFGIYFSNANGKLSKDLGLNDNKFINTNPIQFFGTDTARNSIINTFNGKPTQFEFRRRAKYYQVNLEPVNENSSQSESVTDIIGTLYDITEKRKIERNFSLMAHTMASLNEAISITDAEDNFVYINPAFTKLYGYTIEDLANQKSNILWSSLNPLSVTEKILPATLNGGWTGQLFNKNRAGKDFLISLRTSAVRDFNHDIIGCVGIATEVEVENAYY